MTAKQKRNLRKMRKIRAVVTVALALATIATSLLAVAAVSKVTRIESDEFQETGPEPEEDVMPDVAKETISRLETEHHQTETNNPEDGYDDSDILVRIAMAEAEGEGTYGKALVMLVVLNRVGSSLFPDSIEGVVFQENQFSTVGEGGRYYTSEPDEECYEALRLVESGWDESCGALYFESCEGDSWHSENLHLLFQYGGHKFYT